jgi:DNA-binding response OmpR family regulator
MRVLVIVSELSERSLISAVLTRAGGSVLAAGEPRTVLDEFEAGQYDLAIMDAGLGRIDGILFANQLRGFDSKMRIAIISGDPLNEARATEEGFDFLLKPFSENALEAMVQRLAK